MRHHGYRQQSAVPGALSTAGFSDKILALIIPGKDEPYMAELRDLIRPNITQIPQYHPGRPTDDEVIEKGIAKLASNENPLPPPEPVLQRMREMLERVRLYPDAECERLTRALAERLDVAPECIIVGRGSDEVIHMLGLAFLNPGDEVIMPKPPFTLYPSTTLLMGATPVMIPWKDYQHDLEAMAEAVTERTKLIFVANPDNPTADCGVHGPGAGGCHRCIR